MVEGEPFRIVVPEAELAELQTRLARTRWAHVGARPGWASGTDPAYLRGLVDYWRSGFDWRAREAELNALPHRTIDVGGRLHFIHVPARAPGGVPLLLLHGWPDSFLRFHETIVPLSAASDLVIPSLPGFAFSGDLRAPDGEAPNRFSARLLWDLMTERLGYRRFAVAGGDGGSVVAQILALEHPEAVLGVHLTDLGWHAYAIDRATASRAERKFLDDAQKRQMADGAYALVQMAEPRTLAPALADSPVGLASWIVDRFQAWSDCGGDLDQSFSKDDLLTNIMIYWATRTIGASIANYHAEAQTPSLTVADRVEVPVAVALFPKEPSGVPPRSLAERTLNVQRWTEMPRGGHFGPLEEPELYANDVLAFLRSLREQPRRPPPDASDAPGAPGGTEGVSSHV